MALEIHILAGDRHNSMAGLNQLMGIIYLQVQLTCTCIYINNFHLIETQVEKCISDLRQVGGFLPVVRFPPTNKTDIHYITEILLKVALNTIKQTNKQTNKLQVENALKILTGFPCCYMVYINVKTSKKPKTRYHSNVKLRCIVLLWRRFTTLFWLIKQLIDTCVAFSHEEVINQLKHFHNP